MASPVHSNPGRRWFFLWFSEGPIILTIENFQTGLVWAHDEELPAHTEVSAGSRLRVFGDVEFTSAGRFNALESPNAVRSAQLPAADVFP